MKYEWKKINKLFYLSKYQPEKIMVPKFIFFRSKGKEIQMTNFN